MCEVRKFQVLLLESNEVFEEQITGLSLLLLLLGETLLVRVLHGLEN